MIDYSPWSFCLDSISDVSQSLSIGLQRPNPSTFDGWTRIPICPAHQMPSAPSYFFFSILPRSVNRPMLTSLQNPRRHPLHWPLIFLLPRRLSRCVPALILRFMLDVVADLQKGLSSCDFLIPVRSLTDLWCKLERECHISRLRAHVWMRIHNLRSNR